MDEQKKTHKHRIVALIGLLIIALGIFADQLPISGGAGIGVRQAIVIVAGILIMVIGLKPCGCCCDKKKTSE